MFSCCALFSADEGGADTEHLKELDEIDIALQGGPPPLSIETDGNTTSRSLGNTPLSSSPRTVAAQQRAEEAAAFAEMGQQMPVETMGDEPMESSEERPGLAVEGGGDDQVARTTDAAAGAEVGVGVGVGVGVRVGMDPDAEAETQAQAQARAADDTDHDADAGVRVGDGGSAMPQEAMTALQEREEKLRELRKAQEAASAATAETERRRVEEEALAQAAREAESEARKAELLAEEAKKVKAEANHRAAEERAAAQREVEEEEEMARREAEAAAAEEAKRFVISALRSDHGLRLQKHGRNARTTTKTLHSRDESIQTITWGKAVYDLTKMLEVRLGTEADSLNPGLTGTEVLRLSKKAQGAMDRSFSLLFPERSLDFTADSKKQCEQLVTGFRALSAVHRG